MELTAKEKAEDLFFKMHKVETIQGVCYMTIHEAKQCALIAVDEVLIEIRKIYDFYTEENIIIKYKYWEQVKTEINNL